MRHLLSAALVAVLVSTAGCTDPHASGEPCAGPLDTLACTGQPESVVTCAQATDGGMEWHTQALCQPESYCNPSSPACVSYGTSSSSGGGSSGGVCCKHCGSSSKPCGDSCISTSSTCHSPPGCAC